MSKVYTAIMILSMLAVGYLVVGAIQYDLNRMTLRDTCTELDGVAIMSFGKVVCIDKSVVKGMANN